MNIKNIKFLEITVIREIYRNSGSSAEVKNKIKYRVQTQYRHTTDNERVKKKMTVGRGTHQDLKTQVRDSGHLSVLTVVSDRKEYGKRRGTKCLDRSHG